MTKFGIAASLLMFIGMLAVIFGILFGGGAGSISLFPSAERVEKAIGCSWSIETVDAQGRIHRYCPSRYNGGE